MANLFSSESVALVLLVVSALGLGVMIRRKIPLLRIYTVNSESNLKGAVNKLTDRLKENTMLKDILTPEILLQRILSKIRIFALRTEAKSSEYLESLRRRAQEKKQQFSENYWGQIRKKKQ